MVGTIDIIKNINKDNIFSVDSNKPYLYMAVTRALHRLTISEM